MKINNKFRIAKKVKYDRYNATIFEIEHIETKAKIFWIKTNHKIMFTEIAFNTPPINDKGITHVIEHMVLDGSEKYPSTAIFSILNGKTYSRGHNAVTDKKSTKYYFDSIFESDMLLNFKVLIDCIYKPSFLSDKNIFLREGIRFDYDEESEKLLINGTVFNEMKRQSHEIMKHNKAINRSEGDVLVSGGVPEAIINLKYEETIDYYKKYYLPSNSTIYLSGDININSFLNVLEEYYDEFKYQDIDLRKGYVNKNKNKIVELKVSVDKIIKNKKNIKINYFKQNFNYEDFAYMYLITEYLNSKNIKIRDELLKFDYCINDNLNFNISLEVSKSDDPDEVLKEIKEKLINHKWSKTKLKEEIILIKKAHTKMHKVNNELNEFIASEIEHLLNFGKGIEDLAGFYKNIEKINRENIDVVKDYLDSILDIEDYSIVVQVPKLKYVKDIEKKLENKIEKYKDRLSDDEKAKIKGEAAEYLKWNELQYNKKIKLDTKSSLNDFEVNDIEKRKIDGVTVLYSDYYDSNIIIKLVYNFDSNDISKYFMMKLLDLLYKEIDCSEDLKKKIKKLNLKHYVKTIFCVDGKNLVTNYNINFRTSKRCISYIYEVLDFLNGNIKFKNGKTVRKKINDEYKELKKVIKENRLLDKKSARSLKYYHETEVFLARRDEEILKMYEGMLKLKTKEILELLNKNLNEVIRKENLVFKYIGRKENYKEVFNDNMRKYLKSIENKLCEDKATNRMDYIPYGSREGIVTSIRTVTFEMTGKFKRYKPTYRVYNSYLYNMFFYNFCRAELGAYGVDMRCFSTKIFYMCIGDLPDIKDITSKLKAFIINIKSKDVLNEELREYMRYVSKMEVYPFKYKLDEIDNTMNGYFDGVDKEFREGVLKSYEETTIEGFYDYLDEILEIIDEKYYCSYGNENILMDNKDLFRVISDKEKILYEEG
ncbi:MAG: insulinase family protein [Clostridia bacterium]|jgi:Zn-dependent M16 (insulinase) family peptidase|nr:insulinase family protein [Clostridia bacterium]